MTGGLALGIVALAFGGLAGLACVLQWRGRLGRGRDPGATLERLYLLMPVAVMFVIVGALFVGDAAGLPVVDAIRAGGILVALLIGAVGIGLWVWQPNRLRPAWQKRQVEGRTSGGRAADGRYAIDVVVHGEPVRVEQRYGDITSATTAAHHTLDVDAGATYITVVDTKTGAAVRVVER